MSGGLRTIAARSRWGVSPVRMPTRTLVGADAAQRRAQVALDVVGERLQRADVHDARARAAARLALALSRSSAHRNAASVLPDPVGADTSTCSPRGDRRPRLRLGGRGRRERPLEPLADTRAEAGKGHQREASARPGTAYVPATRLSEDRRQPSCGAWRSTVAPPSGTKETELLAAPSERDSAGRSSTSLSTVWMTRFISSCANTTATQRRTPPPNGIQV